MTIIYRLSSGGYQKEKPDYINNMSCLGNTFTTLRGGDDNIIIIADKLKDDELSQVKDLMGDLYEGDKIIEVNEGNGASTFRLALDEALKLPDDMIVYFVESDYIHRINSMDIIQDAINIGANYVTLYLHPDKFIPPNLGGNPLVSEDGGYPTKIYKGKCGLYGIFDSTTMTFAAEVKTLREDKTIIDKHISGTYPADAPMFWELMKEKQRMLLCPLTTYSTHGETRWMAPLDMVDSGDLVDEWESYLN